MPLTYLISPPLYSEHLNLVTHKQVRKERKKEKKKKNYPHRYSLLFRLHH